MSTRLVVTLARPAPAQMPKRELYLGAIVRAGATVVPVFPGEPAPDEFDALFLTGGEDVAPSRYFARSEGAERIDEERDALEFDTIERALRRRAPILGVCRGFQVLNVALGGSLLQQVEGHRSQPPAPRVSHEVIIAPGSLLEEACGRGPLLVNSWHHQGVRPSNLARGLRATAVVDDLVEAFEAPHLGWVVAVQWHPERSDEVDAAATRIFAAFVAAAAMPADHWMRSFRGVH